MSNAFSHHPTVLIVEDDDGVLALLDAALRNAGFRGTTATGDEAALARLVQQRFDVLIVALTPSSVKRMAFGERARDLYLYQIVIIMLSEPDTAYLKLAALELFADDFLVKPVDMEELAERIKSRLRRIASE